MIREIILTTRSAEDRFHIAPMGVHFAGDEVIVMPFRPSTTLDNILATRQAVINYTDDVRVFAGCLTGRRDWPLIDSVRVGCPRLAGALAHAELELTLAEPDDLRPRLHMRIVHEATHAPFRGFNRAQFAVLEAAILVSRLNLLPWGKIESELAYLRTGLEKTAGAAEREAWGWLMQAIEDVRTAGPEKAVGA